MNRSKLVAICVVLIVFAADTLFIPTVTSSRLWADEFRRPSTDDDFATLKGVSTEGAPNEILYLWHGRSYYEREDEYQTWQEDSQIHVVDGVFDASGYKFDDAFIDELKVATEIKWLCLGPQVKGSDLDWIGQMTWLRGLSLWGAELGECELSQLENLSDLEWLDLSRARLNFRFEERLDRLEQTLPALPKLEVLLLSYTKIGDGFIGDEHLPDDEKYPCLTVLDLSSYGVITDAGISQIAVAFPRLRYLNLYGQSNITPKSVDALSQLTSLKFLDVGDSGLRGSRLTSGVLAIEELERKLPICKISSSN